MAHNVYIRGLSGAGFRTPKTGGGFGRVNQDNAQQVDIDDHKTQLLLAGERDNFIRVPDGSTTTVTIVGLSRRGFRVQQSSDSAWVMVVLGGDAITVDLANASTRRILYRSKRDWVVASDATAVSIRGIQNEQNGFEVRTKEAVVLTGTNAANATNGKVVTIGAASPVTYTLKSALTEAQATGTITTSGTGAANNDTVTVGSTTYTFKTTLTGAANEVLRDGTEDHDLTNLKAAINGEAGAGTLYGTGTVAQQYVTAGAVTSHAITLTGKVGSGTNGNLALAKTGSVLSVSGANMTGGVNPVANEVLIAGSADATLTNLSRAINASGGTAGTDWSSNTVANADVSASAVAAHAITFTEKGDGSIALTATTDEPTYSFGATGSGITKVYRGVTATLDASTADDFNYQQLRRQYKQWIES